MYGQDICIFLTLGGSAKPPLDLPQIFVSMVCSWEGEEQVQEFPQLICELKTILALTFPLALTRTSSFQPARLDKWN